MSRGQLDYDELFGPDMSRSCAKCGALGLWNRHAKTKYCDACLPHKSAIVRKRLTWSRQYRELRIAGANKFEACVGSMDDGARDKMLAEVRKRNLKRHV